jgi:aminopeptidase-like protein
MGSPPVMGGIVGELAPTSDSVGLEMYELIEELYSIPRSLTGEGVRETLRRVRRQVPFQFFEVPSGTRIYDWVIPNEWNLRDAWIADLAGDRIVDLKESPLHVLGYSVPIRARIPVEELRPRAFALPEHPDWIPYRTSYYGETWGFCLTQRQSDALTDVEYDVCIDASLEPGHLTYAEFVIEGETESEVLFSANICHPAQCNDGLSGLALVTTLARHLRPRNLRYSYRFLLSPGTLGPLSWLAANEAGLSKLRHGLVVTCVGDRGRMTYKQTRRGDAEIDRAVASVLESSGDEHELRPFVPWGGDERQFCSPGFDLPVGVLTRSPPGEFPEYHSSADDLTCVSAAKLADSFQKYLAVIDLLETNATYVNRSPKGEPQLGRRGLYRTVSGGPAADSAIDERALLWVLNLSDGSRSLLDIAERSRVPFAGIRAAASLLKRHGLVEETRSASE